MHGNIHLNIDSNIGVYVWGERQICGRELTKRKKQLRKANISSLAINLIGRHCNREGPIKFGR